MMRQIEVIRKHFAPFAHPFTHTPFPWLRRMFMCPRLGMRFNPPILLLRPASTFKYRSHQPRQIFLQRTTAQQSRSFSNPLTPLQTLTASRILPYHAHQIYNIIADIEAYPQFIPYCTSSTINSYSSPDPTHKKQWPRTADLRIGYGPYDEVFKSNVYCVPYTALEAVSGSAEPSLPQAKLPHYYDNSQHPERISADDSMFTSLLTRWSFKEFPFKPLPPNGKSPQEGNANANASVPRTEVSLLIEVQFASAVYSVLSQAAAPKVAGLMVEAFEKRAKETLGDGYGPTSRAESDSDSKSSLQGIVGGTMKM